MWRLIYPEAAPRCGSRWITGKRSQADDFFKSYRRAMKGHPLFPSEHGIADTLVTLFMVEKASAS